MASARWTDVGRVRAYKAEEMTAAPVCVALRLRNGTEVVVHEAVPGFAAFLAAAEAKLPGMQPRARWWASVTRPAEGRNDVVLFERCGAGVQGL